MKLTVVLLLAIVGLVAADGDDKKIVSSTEVPKAVDVKPVNDMSNLRSGGYVYPGHFVGSTIQHPGGAYIVPQPMAVIGRAEHKPMIDPKLEHDDKHLKHESDKHEKPSEKRDAEHKDKEMDKDKDKDKEHKDKDKHPSEKREAEHKEKEMDKDKKDKEEKDKEHKDKDKHPLTKDELKHGGSMELNGYSLPVMQPWVHPAIPWKAGGPHQFLANPMMSHPGNLAGSFVQPVVIPYVVGAQGIAPGVDAQLAMEARNALIFRQPIANSMNHAIVRDTIMKSTPLPFMASKIHTVDSSKLGPRATVATAANAAPGIVNPALTTSNVVVPTQHLNNIGLAPLHNGAFGGYPYGPYGGMPYGGVPYGGGWYPYGPHLGNNLPADFKPTISRFYQRHYQPDFQPFYQSGYGDFQPNYPYAEY